jgi:hypothetical protein
MWRLFPLFQNSSWLNLSLINLAKAQFYLASSSQINCKHAPRLLHIHCRGQNHISTTTSKALCTITKTLSFSELESIWKYLTLITSIAYAVAQAVICWLPIKVVQIQTWVKSCGICDGQSSDGAVFSKYFCLPCQSFIPLVAPQSSYLSSKGWYNRPISDFSSIPAQ